MQENDPKTVIQSTRRSALYLWSGLSLALTLFFVQSQLVFVKRDPLPSQQIEWMMIALGSVTFLFGLFFFKNYTRIRYTQIMRMPFSERKQTLLVAFVFQYVLFETLGLYGVLVSVLTQSTEKAVPFILFAYFGFYLSFPRREKIAIFFKNEGGGALSS